MKTFILKKTSIDTTTDQGMMFTDLATQNQTTADSPKQTIIMQQTESIAGEINPNLSSIDRMQNSQQTTFVKSRNNASNQASTIQQSQT